MVNQLIIGTTRALLMDTPEGIQERRWWFEIRDPSIAPPLILALRHVNPPRTGDSEFERWIKANVPETEYLDMGRIWRAIRATEEVVTQR